MGNFLCNNLLFINRTIFFLLTALIARVFLFVTLPARLATECVNHLRQLVWVIYCRFSVSTATFFTASAAESSFFGGLIHTAVGSCGGCGSPLTNRSG